MLLNNGSISGVIRLKLSGGSWNFNRETENRIKLYREIKVKATNTCGFDSLVHILQFSAIDNPIYESYMKNSEHKTCKLIRNLLRDGVAPTIYLERLKILNEFYPIERAVECTSLSPFRVYSEDFIRSIWTKSFDTEPCGFRSYHFSNKKCQSRGWEAIAYLSINENIINKDRSYRKLQKAVLYDVFLRDMTCRVRKCKGLMTEENHLSIHVCIEMDVRDPSNRENTMECPLNEFPTTSLIFWQEVPTSWYCSPSLWPLQGILSANLRWMDMLG